MKEEQILASAKSLFTKYGFKKVSMDEIASDAGVTKKTVYTYFSSKEELLKYCIKEELENMRKIIENVESKKLDEKEIADNILHFLMNGLKRKEVEKNAE